MPLKKQKYMITKTTPIKSEITNPSNQPFKKVLRSSLL